MELRSPGAPAVPWNCGTGRLVDATSASASSLTACQDVEIRYLRLLLHSNLPCLCPYARRLYIHPAHPRSIRRTHVRDSSDSCILGRFAYDSAGGRLSVRRDSRLRPRPDAGRMRSINERARGLSNRRGPNALERAVKPPRMNAEPGQYEPDLQCESGMPPLSKARFPLIVESRRVQIRIQGLASFETAFQRHSRSCRPGGPVIRLRI